MSKVILSSSLMDARGKMGNVVFRRHGNEHIMAHTPIVGDHVPTAKQAAQQQRFKLAAIYGSAVLADPAKKAIYADKAKQKGITVFALTIADFLHAPSVDNIDLSAYTGKAGETITIQASDDVVVAGVAVRILDTTGAVLEQGPATGDNGSNWSYKTTTALPVGQPVTIEVTASDLPGHTTTKTQTKS
jgi:hypothetical protein